MASETIIGHDFGVMRVGGSLQQCQANGVAAANDELRRAANTPLRQDDLSPAIGVLVAVILGSSAWIALGILLAACLALI